MGKKVLSFSLWGNQPKYTTGAIRNAETIPTIYPGWEAWFYLHQPTVPPSVIQTLSSFPYVRVILRDTMVKPTTWRFEPIDDPQVDIMAVRDCDSRVTLREKYAVDEWMLSETLFHIMRDHPDHTHLIMAGMFDTKKLSFLPSWRQAIDKYKLSEEYHHFYDMEFLQEIVYPRILSSCIIHDSFYKKEPQARPFPVPYDETFDHVGSYRDEHEQPSHPHIFALKRAFLCSRLTWEIHTWSQFSDALNTLYISSRLDTLQISHSFDVRKRWTLFESIQSWIERFPKMILSTIHCSLLGLLYEEMASLLLEDNHHLLTTTTTPISLLRISLLYRPDHSPTMKRLSSLLRDHFFSTLPSSSTSTTTLSCEDQIQDLVEALRYDPDNPYLYMDISDQFRSIGNIPLFELYASLCESKLGSLLSTSSTLSSKQRQDYKELLARVYFHFGSVSFSLEHISRASYYYHKAYALHPTNFEILNSLGVIAGRQGNSEESEYWLVKAVQCFDDNHQQANTRKNLHESVSPDRLYLNLSTISLSQCDFRKLSLYTRLDIPPSTLDVYQKYISMSRYMSFSIPHDQWVSYLHKADTFFPNQISRYCVGYRPPLSVTSSSSSFEETPIRLGCLLGIPMEKSVLRFVQHWIRYLSSLASFRVFVLQIRPFDPSLFPQCTCISNLSEENVRSLHLDILMDLFGCSISETVYLLSKKVAPIQISYCGDPGTTGLPSMDYRIADRDSETPETRRYYVERLVYLPRTFLCYESLVPTPPLSRCCSSFTFGSFQCFKKYNENVVRVWTEILRRCPKSVLAVKAYEFEKPSFWNRWISYFPSDIRPRISKLAYSKTHEEHIEQYSRIDISLDTFPYAGTTTTCESLWAGVPVISLLDTTTQYHHQNVSRTLLKHGNCSDTLTSSYTEYVDKAYEWYSFFMSHSRPIRSRQEIHSLFMSSDLSHKSLFGKEMETLLKNIMKTYDWTPYLPDSS